MMKCKACSGNDWKKTERMRGSERCSLTVCCGSVEVLKRNMLVGSTANEPSEETASFITHALFPLLKQEQVSELRSYYSTIEIR